MEIDESYIHLAISMVEMDTDTILTEAERQDMVKRIKERLENVL